MQREMTLANSQRNTSGNVFMELYRGAVRIMCVCTCVALCFPVTETLARMPLDEVLEDLGFSKSMKQKALSGKLVQWTISEASDRELAVGVLVFMKTKIGAQKLGRILKRDGMSADSIHGDKSAEARYTVLTQFDRGKIRCMVATDVAARGIDVDDIELVVNFDMPQSVEDYVHRVGRTGRIGKAGHALSLVSPSERGVHRAVLRHLAAKTDVEADDASKEAEALNPLRNGRGHGGRSGGGRGGGQGGGGRGGGGRGAGRGKGPRTARPSGGGTGQGAPPRRSRRRA